MQIQIAKQIINHFHYHGQQANNDTEISAEILVDKINNKPQPWRKKKVNSIKLAHAMRGVGEHMNKKANRVYWCSDELFFTAEPKDGGKLYSAAFCRDRLCATCNWRKAIKVFNNLSQVIDVAQDENPNLEPIFLTLTVKNPTGAELPFVLDDMFKAWARMTENRKFRQSIKGYFRALEVTYNKETGAYHPHFHAILMVDKTYFTDTKQYLHHENWVHLWRVSARLDYDPSVRIQAVREKKDRKRVHIAEVAKYTVKDSDVIQKNPQDTVLVVAALTTALHRRRLFAFGGILFTIAKRLKMDKPEEGDLININEDNTIREDIFNQLVAYKWDFGLQNYVRV